MVRAMNCNISILQESFADVITKLKDVCSKETLLTLLPFVENPAVEIKKCKQEQASTVSAEVVGADDGGNSV